MSDKISSALAERKTDDTYLESVDIGDGPFDRLAKAAKADDDSAPIPLDFDALDALSTSADELLRQLTSQIDAMVEERDKKRVEAGARIRADYSDHLSEQQMSALIDTEVRSLVKDQLKNTDEKRYETIKSLQAIAERVGVAKSRFASERHILARAGLGSEMRARLESSTAASGPVELRNFAEEAVAKGDKILAAVVCARLDALPPDDRRRAGFTGQSLARALVGDEFQRISARITRVENALRDAIHVNRGFESGRGNSIAKISTGLGRRKERRETTEVSS